jgi:hypothetical protein
MNAPSSLAAGSQRATPSASRIHVAIIMRRSSSLPHPAFLLSCVDWRELSARRRRQAFRRFAVLP